MAAPAYELAVGDTATLISGGPEMTVVKLNKAVPNPPPPGQPVEESVDCWWFDADKVTGFSTLCKASFPPAALVPVKERKAPESTAP